MLFVLRLKQKVILETKVLLKEYISLQEMDNQYKLEDMRSKMNLVFQWEMIWDMFYLEQGINLGFLTRL